MTHMRSGLTAFNELPETDAVAALSECCASGRWIVELARRRPHESRDALLSLSDRVVAQLTETDVQEALAGHPRIGDRTAAGSWSSTEQSGMDTAEPEVQRLITAGNRAYEETFGHVYLVCATGKTANELLAILTNRLANDPETEWSVTREELAKINRIRLAKLLDQLGHDPDAAPDEDVPA